MTAAGAWFRLFVDSTVNVWADLEGENLLVGDPDPVGSLPLTITPAALSVPLNAGPTSISVRTPDGKPVGGIPVDTEDVLLFGVTDRVPSTGDIVVTPLAQGAGELVIRYRDPHAGYAEIPITVPVTITAPVYTSGVWALSVSGPTTLAIDDAPVALTVHAQAGKNLPAEASIRVTISRPACCEVTTELRQAVDLERGPGDLVAATLTPGLDTYTIGGLDRPGTPVPALYLNPISIGTATVTVSYTDPVNGLISHSFPVTVTA